MIETILELAQWTRSWCNIQPWQVAITEGAGATDRIGSGRPGRLRPVPPREPDLPFPVEFGVCIAPRARVRVAALPHHGHRG
nr:hypothetical protein [Rhodococcus pseudokoreensis]